MKVYDRTTNLYLGLLVKLAGKQVWWAEDRTGTDRMFTSESDARRWLRERGTVAA